MALVVGALLAFAVGLFATVSGLDRDRAFYPTVAIVIASYYCLFAVMGASTRALVLESLVAGAFFALAIFGFCSSLWVVVIALGAHGVFDLTHGTVRERRRWSLIRPGSSDTASSKAAFATSTATTICFSTDSSFSLPRGGSGT